MRGVVSLAAALAIPVTMANGQPFPQRIALIFLTFAAILVTLVFQGLTLPPLIRALHLASPAKTNPEEQSARRAMLQAALACLEELRSNQGPDFDLVFNYFSQAYRRRLSLLAAGEGEDDRLSAVNQKALYQSTGGRLRDVERSTVIGMRDRQEIGDSVLRTLERELDFPDIRFLSN